MAKPKLTTSGKIFFGTIFLVVLLILFLTLSSQNNILPQQSTTSTSTTTTATQITGRILIGFKDDFRKVPVIGTVTMLNFNVKEVDVRENNQTQWIPVFVGSKTFDIIAFSNQTAIIADNTIPLKTYTQERVVLGNGEIKIYSPIINVFNRTYSLYPELNETALSYSFTLAQNEITFLVFDLSVENSINHRLEGYFLLPQFTLSSSILITSSPENSVFIS
jgi:hypothetical protein